MAFSFEIFFGHYSTTPISVHSLGRAYLDTISKALILGGTRDNVRLKEIWIYDLDEYNMPRSASDFNGHVIGQKPKKGPDMLYARSEFGCSTFKHDEDEVVVVSGGRGAENRAEILFISTGDWMPRKYCSFHCLLLIQFKQSSSLFKYGPTFTKGGQ